MNLLFTLCRVACVLFFGGVGGVVLQICYDNFGKKPPRSRYECVTETSLCFFEFKINIFVCKLKRNVCVCGGGG